MVPALGRWTGWEKTFELVSINESQVHSNDAFRQCLDALAKTAAPIVKDRAQLPALRGSAPSTGPPQTRVRWNQYLHGGPPKYPCLSSRFVTTALSFVEKVVDS